MKRPFIISLWLFVFCNDLSAQITTERLQRLIKSQYELDILGIMQQHELKGFYKVAGYVPVWTAPGGRPNRDVLIQIIRKAADEGLKEKDYQYDFMQTFSEEAFAAGDLGDSLAVEIKFCDAAIHFFTDLVGGNKHPDFGYDGLNYYPDMQMIPQLLAEYCLKNELPVFFDQLASLTPEINAIREKLARLNKLTADNIYQEEKITSENVSPLNKPLLQKLYLLGIADSVDKKSAAAIKGIVREAQRQFNLLSDGVLRATIKAELNVPVATRKQQLALAINYYRWLFCLSQQQPVVVVNIPAAYLKVYGSEEVLLGMKMIVGKPSTPTPTLTSKITEVILYPYWKVPHSIATKELLPAIKRNVDFIEANNFQIINATGKIIDPYKIDWDTFSASNFPYTIRQSTGCDNALGLIKLNFYNPVGVYLHDTPDKGLFTLNKRYFSHGCMRMEKPMELGHFVLKNNRIAIDTLEDKGCIRDQPPVVIPADEKVPVVVWYNPVGTDTTGRVIFYDDVYRKFTKKK